jgi:hypothetical protein
MSKNKNAPDDSNFWLLFGGLFSLLGGLSWLVYGIPTKHIVYPIEKNIDVRILFSSGPIILGLFLLKIYYDLNKTRINKWLALKGKREKK